MRVWTKSACVVLAWGMLLILLVAGMSGSVPVAQASVRMASRTTEVTLPVTAASPTAAKPATTAARYVVRPGDTLSGIAAALGVRGGWQALYATNRTVIGADPDVIRPGTVLVLPGQATPVGYTVQAGDSLAEIAAALGVRGGWQALYAANRKAIGPDPDVIHPGTVLVLPGRPARAASASRPASHRQARPAPLATHAVRPHHTPQTRAPQTRTSTPAAGMPQWLRIMLLAAALLIGAAFLAELALAIARRRRRPAAGNARLETAPPEHVQPGNVQPETASPGPPRSCKRFVLADYDRLVVTHNQADDLVCVLRPPGEDPRAILRVARLVLPEDPYEELAEQLGVPASWPME